MCFKCYRSRDLVHQDHRFTKINYNEGPENDDTTSSEEDTDTLADSEDHGMNDVGGLTRDADQRSVENTEEN